MANTVSRVSQIAPVRAPTPASKKQQPSERPARQADDDPDGDVKTDDQTPTHTIDEYV